MLNANAKGEAEYTLIHDGHDLAELFMKAKRQDTNRKLNSVQV